MGCGMDLQKEQEWVETYGESPENVIDPQSSFPNFLGHVVELAVLEISNAREAK